MLNKRDSEKVVNVICTILFGAFTFFYLYFFQNDMLAYAQYILAEGTTTYNSLVGAFIITGVLLLLSLLSASAFVKNLAFLPALYHLPSLLVLAAITDINIVDAGQKNVFGYTWFVSFSIFILFLVVNGLIKRVISITNYNKDVIYKSLWINLFLLFFMCFFAVTCGNTSEKDHITIRSERLMSQGEYYQAYKLFDNCTVNSRELTIIKAYSLAKTNRLGECFFNTTIVRGSQNLVPMRHVNLKFFPKDSIYKNLGGIPSEGLSVRSYLEIMNQRKMLSKIGRNYLLMACLLDKDLDKFAEYYKEYRDSAQFIPKHFSEALTLYSRIRSNPVISLNIPEKEADFEDFQAMIKKYPDKTLCENALRNIYGNTYWFYYYFTSSRAFTQSVSNEN